MLNHTCSSNKMWQPDLLKFLSSFFHYWWHFGMKHFHLHPGLMYFQFYHHMLVGRMFSKLCHFVHLCREQLRLYTQFSVLLSNLLTFDKLCILLQSSQAIILGESCVFSSIFVKVSYEEYCSYILMSKSIFLFVSLYFHRCNR